MNNNTIANLIIRALAQIDELIKRQLDLILHHPRFQQLEASWRGVHYLVNQAALNNESRVKLKILALSWHELSKDILRAIEFDQSQLFNKIYNDEFGHPGGEPYGLLLGDYSISHRRKNANSVSDMQVLNHLTKIAAASFSPFIAAADPTLFGLDSFAELDRPINLPRTFQQSEYAEWKALRQSEDSRFLGLVLPRVLARLPYKEQLASTHPFYYEENVQQGSAKDYLWANPVYCFAAVVIRSFCQNGWFLDIRGVKQDKLSGGVVIDLPRQARGIGSNSELKYATEVCVTERLEKELSDWGLITLCECKHTELTSFFSCPSIQQAKLYERQFATDNAKLSSMLHYVLCVSRFAQYVKMIMRNKVGTFASPIECERFLQKWLQGYCAAGNDLNRDLKAKYPLRSAKVEVVEQPGKPGCYLCVLRINPHMQFDQSESYLQLVTELVRN